MNEAAPPPPLRGLLETALYVEDLKRSKGFFQLLFGFVCHMEDERMCALGVTPGAVLLLFRKGGSVEPSITPHGTIPPHDGIGRLHMAFAIPSNTIEAWEHHLTAHGVAVESRITWPRGGTSLYFRDPDGHSIEVATPGLWPGDDGV